MKTDETNPADWFLLARDRLQAADAVRQACGPGASAVELLQESVERYLKGYLVGKGWPLQKIHNLSMLLDVAVQRDPRFKEFANLCDTLTTQFWAQHYPGGDLTDVGADYDDLRREVDVLVTKILDAFPRIATGTNRANRGKP
jgi:HEPN domain-containing protein